MKGSASHLLEFLEGSRKRFIIPVYQRNYDWKTENCKQLFDNMVQVVFWKKLQKDEDNLALDFAPTKENDE